MGGATKEYEGGGVVCTAVELLHHTRYRSRNRLRWATALSEVKEKVSSLSLVLASGTPQMDKRKCKANAAARVRS